MSIFQTPLTKDFLEALHQVHWATQVMATAGLSFAEEKPDWSHSSLTGVNREQTWLLKGAPLPALNGKSMMLDIQHLALSIAGTDNRSLTTLNLVGKRLDEAYDWLTDTAGVQREALTLPAHDMPEHAITNQQPFYHAVGLKEVYALYCTTDGVLKQVAAEYSRASIVRCWPHHFDIAFLITLDTDKNHEEARSIGVGLAPPDRFYHTPYFYVTPWPYPDVSTLPELESPFFWHTSSWVGAVLQKQDVKTDPENENHYLSQNLNKSIQVCLELL